MLTSLYIHIPFCNQVCTYCDFNKEVAKDSKKEMYVDCLCDELFYHRDKFLFLKTVYIGGGTPSSLDYGLLEKLLVLINKVVDVKQLIEFSIETNPNDISSDFVSLITKYGVNRVSVGVQTFDEKQLLFLNRTHREVDIYRAISLLRDGGIDNINVDMMFSLINQSFDDLILDVDKVLALEVDHISYYSLILEEKTKLFYLYNRDEFEMNNEELEMKMYEYVMDRLLKDGYVQYEISNYCKKNNPSFHNMAYWTNEEYLGVGSGAHSLVSNKRFYQTSNVGKYMEKMKKGLYETYDFYEYDNIVDEMILGLRLNKGVNVEYIEGKYHIDLLKEYSELNIFLDNGYLEIVDGYIRLTRKGIFIGNEIFKVFLEV